MASFLCMSLPEANSMFNLNGYSFESTLSGGENFNNYGSIILDALSIIVEPKGEPWYDCTKDIFE